MTDDTAPQPIYLKDYRPPAYLVDDVHLTFDLDPNATRVASRIRFVPNPMADDREFFLHGEGLKLLAARIDGHPVEPEMVDGGLRCDVPDEPFTWAAEVEIAPADNLSLEGLYMSNGIYCTQCEAEGFRRITYYPDRPDVLARFTVRIESDEPVMLSNGNPGEAGSGWAEWYDPWPKPSYLFALVAGGLIPVPDRFTTMSGRGVDLNIWVRPGDEEKCGFALEALKASMRWDEEVYGREYDLDIFNIVAVNDFNAGAMENKGLNIFNSALVLASPETATDSDYERIESVIAHEYFHNWTGNRITCRDWFQLCLKEGLTVFRDQQFTSDMRSAAVKRIEDASLIRSHQFREDQGPLAHPVRPESFIEINNFYTITVYEKGAEVIGMLKRLVGDGAYDDALRLYFDRHDGEAATIEDWLACFEVAAGRDLGQFQRWYAQAGTPRITIADDFDDGVYTLDIKQHSPETPDGSPKEPQVIPLAVGLLDAEGREVVETRVLELTQSEQRFEFFDLEGPPIPSLNREFSAPVVIEREQTRAERALLLAHDTDPYVRWEAGQSLLRDALTARVNNINDPDDRLVDGLQQVLGDTTLDPAFRSLMLELPSEGEIAQHLHGIGQIPDPTEIHRAREALIVQIARTLQDQLVELRAANTVTGPYRPTAEDTGKRSLAGNALYYLSRIDGGVASAAQFATADNMTQSISALTNLVAIGKGAEELAMFEDRWRDDFLVLNKWFGLQIAGCPPEHAVANAIRLAEHPEFDWKNPNRFRSVVGALPGNPAGFHQADGAGYRFLANWLIRLDSINPMTAARMSSAFSTWTRYDEDRQALIRAELERIAGRDGLSRDLGEMVGRMLAA